MAERGELLMCILSVLLEDVAEKKLIKHRFYFDYENVKNTLETKSQS